METLVVPQTQPTSVPVVENSEIAAKFCPSEKKVESYRDERGICFGMTMLDDTNTLLIYVKFDKVVSCKKFKKTLI